MPGSSPDENSKVEEVEVKETKTAETTESTDAKPAAESSTAEPKGEKDLVASVKEALEAKEKPPASETEGSQPEKESDKDAKKDGGEAETDSDDLTEEELARLRPKTRKRIENLLGQVHERDGVIADIKPKADQFDHLVRFVENAGLSTQEVNDGFDIMAALKNQPLAAYEKLKPIFQQLQILAGDVLPEELQIAVNQGQITEAHARELARTRSQAAVSTQQLTRRDQQEQVRNQQQETQRQQEGVRSAIAGWEKSKAGSDPDWKPKQQRVMELVELETLRRSNADPNFRWTPDEAVKFADQTLAKVNDEFKRFAPRPKAVTPVTDVASTQSTTKPKTAVEAAKQGLARMSAG